MRALNSEELKLVYGGGDTSCYNPCKPPPSYSCASKTKSKATKCSKTKSHHDNGKHKGWCNKKD